MTHCRGRAGQHSHPGRPHAAHTPVEAASCLSLHRQEDSSLCQSRAGRLLRRPLKPLCCFCSESIKTSYVTGLEKKMQLVQPAQVSRQLFQHNCPQGCSRVRLSPGTETNGLRWKENSSLLQATGKLQPNAGSISNSTHGFYLKAIKWIWQDLVLTILALLSVVGYFFFWQCPNFYKMGIIREPVLLSCWKDELGLC